MCRPWTQYIGMLRHHANVGGHSVPHLSTTNQVHKWDATLSETVTSLVSSQSIIHRDSTVLDLCCPQLLEALLITLRCE